MEILILIGVGWLVYIFFIKNSNQSASSQNLNDIAKTSYSSARQKSSQRSNSGYVKEPNIVLIQRAIDSGRSLKFRYVDLTFTLKIIVYKNDVTQSSVIKTVAYIVT